MAGACPNFFFHLCFPPVFLAPSSFCGLIEEEGLDSSIQSPPPSLLSSCTILFAFLFYSAPAVGTHSCLGSRLVFCPTLFGEPKETTKEGGELFANSRAAPAFHDETNLFHPTARTLLASTVAQLRISTGPCPLRCCFSFFFNGCDEVISLFYSLCKYTHHNDVRKLIFTAVEV